MTDRELLEAAAKAVNGGAWHPLTHDTPSGKWNPLDDDGDALRLAVKLRINIEHGQYSDLSLWINTVSVTAKTHIGAGRGISLFDDAKRTANDHAEPFGDDPYAATRRAIVRAAAAMGEKA